jgi:D-serine deaminase-like pyridoxal phosphate-dependent protein
LVRTVTIRSGPHHPDESTKGRAPILAGVRRALAAIPDTPALVVDRSTIRRNIAEMAAEASTAGVALRPHTKTHKSPLIARLQIAAGAVGIQVAKLGEAEVMAAAGIEDILVGYPIVGAAKLERLARLAASARISVALDDPAVANGVADVARRAGVSIGLYLEVDSGGGRLGVTPAQAPARAVELARLPNLDFRGIFTHEGHAYRCRPGQQTPAAVAAQVADTMRGTAAAIEAAGVPCPEISVGATPTVRAMLDQPGITMVRPGTYVFNDRTQLELGAAEVDHLAAFVAATVVGRPRPDRIVVDAGSKALSSDLRPFAADEPSYGIVIGDPEWEVIGLSEEHGLLAMPPDAAVDIGARLPILPNHICSVVNLFDEMTVVDDGALVDSWPVAARGRMR